MWPPKKKSPRAPATIASYAMNRACTNVGKTIGCGGMDPLHAICSVVQAGLPGLALLISRVMSPTTLMSVFTGGPPACSPGGFETG